MTHDATYKRPIRNGFTLLEMVAAMVLMTILFAAITSLLRSFAEQERTLDQLASASPPTQLLADLVRRDLTNARFVHNDSKSLKLVGNLGQDAATKMSTGRLAEVTYRIERIQNHPWLVRREVSLDVASGPGRAEPIWRGATSIKFTATMEPEYEETSIPAINIPRGLPSQPTGMTPMPARVRFMVESEQEKPLVDLHVLHHWEDG